MRRKRAREQDASDGSDRRITPEDVQQVEFRLAFRGYNERDVDEFLDEVTEAMGALLEDNRRLREESGVGLLGAPDPAEASRQADEIIRRAQEEAARMVGEAEARVAGMSPSAGQVDVRGIPSFLLRERDFLQNMAAMIQEHAETVREMAREARARAHEPAVPEPEAEMPAEPEPASQMQVEPEPEPEPVRAEETVLVPEAPEGAEEEPPPETEVAGPPEVAEPASVPADAAEGAEREPETPQRSLRELFWGED